MTRDELTVLTRGQEKVDEARKIARECPTGYLVVHDTRTHRVFYRDVHSRKEITTDFTEELVTIAHRDLMPHDPDFLIWDRVNSTAAGPRFQVYTVRGK